MGIKLNCDRCDRFIKNVSVKNINTLSDSDVICKICKEVELKHKQYIDRFKAKVVADAKNFTTKWREEYENLLQKAVNERLKMEE